MLVECDMELTPYFYKCLRDRLKADGMSALFIDGRPDPNVPPQAAPRTATGWMILKLTDAVRGSVSQTRVLVLPNLDLLTTGSSLGIGPGKAAPSRSWHAPVGNRIGPDRYPDQTRHIVQVHRSSI